MRLWTVHPKYLDVQGLVAAWREGLLAQKVLTGNTSGYRHHPQLTRFRAQPEPLAAIAAFLRGLTEEAQRRGYHFDAAKIYQSVCLGQIEETNGQLLYEWSHLRAKLRLRSQRFYRACYDIRIPDPHPLFRIVPGAAREWERVKTPRKNP
jgi:hypothetical protein